MNAGKLRVWAIFSLINLFGLGFLGLAGLQGLITKVIQRDSSGICLTTAALFVVGLVLCYRRVWQLNQAFDDLEKGNSPWIARYRKLASVNASNAVEILKVYFSRKVMGINLILPLLPALGLFGTVVGIAYVQEVSHIANADNITEPQVLKNVYLMTLTGLGVAFYTTIVGLVFWFWLKINLWYVNRESARLLEQVLELGVDDALKPSEKKGGE